MHPNYSVEDLEPGMLLLAEPFLEDPSFHRSVILLCEHTTAHSFGLVLNNKQEIVFDSFVDEKVLEDVPLYSGGPVDPTIMQFVHRRPDLIPDGVLIGPGIYWSGSFEVAIDKVVAGEIGFDEIKFLGMMSDLNLLSTVMNSVCRGISVTSKNSSFSFNCNPASFYFLH